MDEALKSVTDTILTTVQGFAARLDGVQRQLDGVDTLVQRSNGSLGAAGVQTKSLGELVTEHAAFSDYKTGDYRAKGGVRLLFDVSPFAGRKAVIYGGGLGTGTTGVQMPVRLPGITGLAMQRLRIRDLLTVRSMTTGAAFDWVKQSSRSNAASPQLETSPKGESTYGWQALSDTVKTIAHFVNVSRQALDDNSWLQDTINSELMYGLLLKEEQEILAGDGTGQHLKGLITQATAYNTALTVANDTKLDKLRHAKLQSRQIGLGSAEPDAFVLNPKDVHDLDLIKDNYGGANQGKYIIGDPLATAPVKTVWNLPIVESDSIAQGSFLVGPFATGATLIDRLQAMIEISYEHASNFTNNVATVLCEERIGLAVQRPDCFVTGAI
jgi:HK97 family phage major capsid protein